MNKLAQRSPCDNEDAWPSGTASDFESEDREFNPLRVRIFFSKSALLHKCSCKFCTAAFVRAQKRTSSSCVKTTMFVIASSVHKLHQNNGDFDIIADILWRIVHNSYPIP